jgi:hypothetical protein
MQDASPGSDGKRTPHIVNFDGVRSCRFRCSPLTAKLFTPPPCTQSHPQGFQAMMAFARIKSGLEPLLSFPASYTFSGIEELHQLKTT